MQREREKQRLRADTSSLRQRPQFLLFVLLAAACVSLAQTQAVPPADQPGTIRGTVVNSVTGAPIPRALVFPPGNHFAMLTDGESHFEFTLPKVANDNPSSASGGQSYTFSSTVLYARKPGFLDEPSHIPVEATPGTEVTVEIHLFDFTGDLYGKELRTQFLERLRPEQRFGSVAELASQIRRDVEAARVIVARVVD